MDPELHPEMLDFTSNPESSRDVELSSVPISSGFPHQQARSEPKQRMRSVVPHSKPQTWSVKAEFLQPKIAVPQHFMPFEAEWRSPVQENIAPMGFALPSKQELHYRQQRPTEQGEEEDYEEEKGEEELSSPACGQASGTDAQMLQAMQRLQVDVDQRKQMAATVASVRVPDWRSPRVSGQGARLKINRNRLQDQEVDDDNTAGIPPKLRPGVVRPSLFTPNSGDSSEDEDDDFMEPRRNTGMVNAIKGLPKSLQYDGKSNWLPFKQKFQRYARACDWTAEQCLDCLCWCLTGKAADFQSIQMEREGEITYQQLLQRLENRFGARELAETAQIRFQQAMQAKDETLDDWADRIMTLATRAFKDLPEFFSTHQSVIRFCQGLYDKETALQVCASKPGTMEEAINDVRWFQHVHQAVYGKSRKRSSDSEDEGDRGVNSVQDHSHDTTSGQMTSTQSTLEEMQDILADIDKVQDSLSKLEADVYHLRTAKPKRNSARLCYHCGQPGHFIRDCPDNQDY